MCIGPNIALLLVCMEDDELANVMRCGEEVRWRRKANREDRLATSVKLCQPKPCP